MKTVFIRGDATKWKNYAEAISFCGGRAMFADDLACAKDCDALLLTGGGDVNPATYGRENTASMGIDEARDEAELELISRFIATGRPILGICRGIQILNAALGGTLIQHIPNANEIHAGNMEIGDRVHNITLTEDSFLRPLYADVIENDIISVNSAHHQAIEKLADCFTPAAWAPDGILEAAQDVSRRIYAVQFHPERMSFNNARPDTVNGRNIFDFFLSII